MEKKATDLHNGTSFHLLTYSDDQTLQPLSLSTDSKHCHWTPNTPNPVPPHLSIKAAHLLSLITSQS